MVFNNQLVNRPQGGTKERGTSDILYHCRERIMITSNSRI